MLSVIAVLMYFLAKLAATWRPNAANLGPSWGQVAPTWGQNGLPEMFLAIPTHVQFRIDSFYRSFNFFWNPRNLENRAPVMAPYIYIFRILALEDKSWCWFDLGY